MAKLSARGRVELARVEKTSALREDGSVCRTRLAMMSDGTMLKNFAVTRPDGSRHDYGWSVAMKAPKGWALRDWPARKRLAELWLGDCSLQGMALVHRDGLGGVK